MCRTAPTATALPRIVSPIHPLNESLTMTFTFVSWRRHAFAAFTTLACTSAALAAQPNALAQAQERYQQDMAQCASGQSYQDPATCRREAGAALAQARRGDLGNKTGAYAKNALQRCAAHKNSEDRAACESRIQGQGDISKESQAGGLLRQSTTVSPAN